MYILCLQRITISGVANMINIIPLVWYGYCFEEPAIYGMVQWSGAVKWCNEVVQWSDAVNWCSEVVQWSDAVKWCSEEVLWSGAVK